jgi:hypothetical protein
VHFTNICKTWIDVQSSNICPISRSQTYIPQTYYVLISNSQIDVQFSNLCTFSNSQIGIQFSNLCPFSNSQIKIKAYTNIHSGKKGRRFENYKSVINLKTGGERECSGWVSSSCSTCDTCRVTVKRHEHHLICKVIDIIRLSLILMQMSIELISYHMIKT